MAKLRRGIPALITGTNVSVNLHFFGDQERSNQYLESLHNE